MKKFTFVIGLFLIVITTGAQNRFLDSCKNLLIELTRPEKRLATLDTLSGSIYTFSFPDTILKYSLQELALARAVNDPVMEANALQNCSWCYSVLGRYPEALDCVIRSEKIANDLDDKLLITRSSLIFCEIYREQGDYKNALLYAYKCKEETDRFFNNDAEYPSIAFQIIGDTYQKFGYLDSGLYFAKMAYNRRKSIQARGDLNTLLGNIYSKKGDYQLALKYYRDGVALCTRDGIGKDLMNALNGMANTFMKMGATDSTIYYSKQTISIGATTQYRLAMLDAAKLITNIYESANKTDSAFKYLKIYLAMKDSLFSQQKITEVENFQFNQELYKQKLANDAEQSKSSTRTWVLLSAIFIMLLVGSIIIRNISLRRKNEKLKSERSQVRFQHQANLLEMQALRAQMNPHFIFNCLNAINHFILKSETEIASDYLTKFSRLMRLVLNNSRQSLISIEEELSMVRLYLDLEKIRFKNAFEYCIHFENDFDISASNIPPLMLQPFVENAIWHGLLQKTGPGYLSIMVKTVDNILIFEITDNGIGRKRAVELKSKSAEVKKSMGIEITRNRLALLNENDEHYSSVEILDLADNNGIASGTKVVLSLKIESTVSEAGL
jgi:tetratricopeptide (TPR) repeat protein